MSFEKYVQTKAEEMFKLKMAANMADSSCCFFAKWNIFSAFFFKFLEFFTVLLKFSRIMINNEISEILNRIFAVKSWFMRQGQALIIQACPL